MIAVVADDHKTHRTTAHVALRHFGITVVAECATGAEAIEAVKKHNPDLVMLDYVMPDKTGVEVADEIRAWGSKAKIIMATSMGQKGAAFGDNVKVDAVLIKPFNNPLVKLALIQAGLF